MILDRQGGPNWFKNWCVAPIIVDPNQDEVYFTPLYYVMSHFSKFIRPGANVVEATCNDSELMVSASLNPDGSVVVVVFNEHKSEKYINLSIADNNYGLSISPQALQTIIFTNFKKI
jgi:glucosylceramidase